MVSQRPSKAIPLTFCVCLVLAVWCWVEMTAVNERRASISNQRALLRLEHVQDNLGRLADHPDGIEWNAHDRVLGTQVSNLQTKEDLLLVALGVLVIFTIGLGVVVLKRSL